MILLLLLILQLINDGKGRVSKASLQIQWPYEIRIPGSSVGKYLLYLTERPIWSDNGRISGMQCDGYQNYVNTLGLAVSNNGDG